VVRKPGNTKEKHGTAGRRYSLASRNKAWVHGPEAGALGRSFFYWWLPPSTLGVR